MWLLAMKGLSGCGKSTLSRALSKQLGWPLIDKDDIRDLLDNHIPAAGALAYDIMFNVARRQLLQGMSVVCDSPLTGTRGYEHAQEIVDEAHASLPWPFSNALALIMSSGSNALRAASTSSFRRTIKPTGVHSSFLCIHSLCAMSAQLSTRT